MHVNMKAAKQVLGLIGDMHSYVIQCSLEWWGIQCSGSMAHQPHTYT